jgi:hypothetical protein
MNVCSAISGGDSRGSLGTWKHVGFGLIARDAEVRTSLHLSCNRVRSNGRKDHARAAFWACRRARDGNVRLRQ